MNTVPYTNASREGRTNPGMLEIIAPTDPRHNKYRHSSENNRAGRRAAKFGQRTRGKGWTK